MSFFSRTLPLTRGSKQWYLFLVTSRPLRVTNRTGGAPSGRTVPRTIRRAFAIPPQGAARVVPARRSGPPQLLLPTYCQLARA